MRRRPASLIGAVTVGGPILGLAGFRLWQALVGGPIQWQDSQQYERVGNRPITSGALWAGRRPPLAPLLWKVTGSPQAFVVVQTVASIAAWTVLALVVGRLAPSRWGRYVGTILVLGFAATRPVTQWDRSVLSESLSLTALALLFAAGIAWANRPTRTRAVALVTAALLFAAARDTQVWVMALLALALGVQAAWRGLRGDMRWAPRAMAVAGALTAVVVMTGASSAISHREIRNVQNALAVRIFPYPDRIAWFDDHGMPQASAVAVLARRIQPVRGFPPVVSIDFSDPDFRPLAQWVRHDAPAVYFRWLLTHPWYDVSEPFQRPERTFNNAGGHLSYYAAADRTDAPALTTVLFPAWWIVALVALIGAVLVLRTQTWKRRGWQMPVLIGALGVPHLLIAWHGDGMEVTRHASVGSVQLRLGMLIAVVGVLGSTRRARAGADPVEVPERATLDAVSPDAQPVTAEVAFAPQ